MAGFFLILFGTYIVIGKKTLAASLLLATALLLIFCLYFIPYQFIVNPNYTHFGDWENAAKELALASGAFVIAGCFLEKNETPLTGFLGKRVHYGVILFSVTIISFGVDHFLFAKQAADYVPSWIPYHLFWMYFTGTALIGSGLAIIFKIKRKLVATLLGAMIFAWFVMLHTPRMIASPAAYIGSEISSAFLALAYSGIAFVIAGKKTGADTL